MNLFVNLYRDSDAERDRELQACLAINVASGLFERIVLLGGRPTFNDFFAQMHRYPDDVNVLANADIWFNPTLKLADGITARQCYALTRWEERPDRSLSHYGHSDSQDVWIFRGAPKVVEGADYHQGIPDCDGRTAYLLRRKGYEVTNPSGSIHAVHMHASQVRNYLLSGRGKARGAPKRVRLGPPVAPVAICDL